MDNLSNALKLVLASVLMILLVAAVFFVGYQAGSETRDDRVGRVVEQVTSSEVEPTVEPTVTVVAPPTESAPTSTAPITASVPSDDEETPLPSDTPDPLPTSTVPPAVSEPATLQESALTEEEALQVLNEVWDLIDSEYFGELPSPQERAYSAIRGMLNTLDDDYTSFSEPSIAEIRRTDAEGSFEGIGAHVTMNDEDVLEIVQTFKGSPAERAGLLPADLVLAVDGQSIVGYGIYEAITLIRGPEGSQVTLTIKRGEMEAFDVSITRARLEIPILESRMLDNDIGYVSLFDFSSPATARLEEAVGALFDKGATALVLDLRGNPGGFLDQAVKVSDLFLDQGLVLTERRSDGSELEFTSSDEGLAQDVPLAILINGGSASASEIVAGAIQDRSRAVLIGETTFGKGSVQLLHTLSDGSELRVTVARWFTPNDHAIHGVGLAPDIEVALTPDDVAADRDPQLDRAVEYLTTGQ